MSEESTVAAMIRKFRQSRPSSRVERANQTKSKGSDKQPWWIQREDDGNELSGNLSPEPKPNSRLLVQPTKPSIKSDILTRKAKEGINPNSKSKISRIDDSNISDTYDRSHKFGHAPPPSRETSNSRQNRALSPSENIYDDSISISSKTLGKLRESLDVDDWIEKEIKSLEKEMRRSRKSEKIIENDNQIDNILRDFDDNDVLNDDNIGKGKGRYGKGMYRPVTKGARYNPSFDLSRSLDNGLFRGSNDTLRGFGTS